MISLIPQTSSDQQLRIKRFLMAALSYIVFLFLIIICQQLGIFILSFTNTIAMAGIVFVLNLSFYIIFRTGFNLKFSDKSLTTIQMASAMLVIMVTIYFIDEVRGTFLLLYIVTLSFGIFRLRTRQFLIFTGLIILSYLTVVFIMMKFQPHRTDIRVEIIRLSVIAVVFIWFSFIGGYINRLHQKIEEMATIDELTKLCNRRKLFTVLKRETELAKRDHAPFCILMADIDNFKRINDNYGHQTGDLVLRKIAERLKRSLRKCDYIGRYGGEEFLLILSYPTLDNALICSERLRNLIDTMEIETDKEPIHVSLSIGATVYIPDEPVEKTLSRADNALYRAKANGKNRIEYDRG